LILKKKINKLTVKEKEKEKEKENMRPYFINKNSFDMLKYIFLLFE
jgi:hypothetical protein